VAALTDVNGTFVEYYEYNVFGEPTIWDVNAMEIVESSVVGNRFMFTGREFDSETGLYYYRARMYSPQTGRFLQVDPIWALNLYAYCGNNPLNWIDPWGLLLERIWNDPAERAQHKDTAITYKKFVSHAAGKTLKELQHEVKTNRVMSERSAPGPSDEYRYVLDPANPGQVVDMRHFLVVGPQGELVGLGIETVQLSGDRRSAFNAQDFLSNKLGKDFYENYVEKYPHLPIDVLLFHFFRDREMQSEKDSCDR